MTDEATETESTDEAASPVDVLVRREFSVGDFVYYDSSVDIGEISDARKTNNGWKYRINYCQFKDPDRGTCGGNGPVWANGYPKQISRPSDILFVAAMKEGKKIKQLKKDLNDAEKNYSALKRARLILDA